MIKKYFLYTLIILIVTTLNAENTIQVEERMKEPQGFLPINLNKKLNPEEYEKFLSDLNMLVSYFYASKNISIFTLSLSDASTIKELLNEANITDIPKFKQYYKTLPLLRRKSQSTKLSVEDVKEIYKKANSNHY